MISAMPAVAVRRGRKRSKTFGRFNLPGSHHSSMSSIKGSTRRHGQSISTISGHNHLGGRAFHRRPLRYDTELDRQRRRFLIYMGTLLLITGLLLVFIGVGAAVPMAQQVGLLLIGIGAVLCIIKVFCSEAHMTDLPQKVPIIEDPESNSGGNNAEEGEEEEATPLANISEFTELPGSESGQDGSHNAHQHNNVTPTSPPNSIPETQVLIGNDSGGGGGGRGRY